MWVLCIDGYGHEMWWPVEFVQVQLTDPTYRYLDDEGTWYTPVTYLDRSLDRYSPTWQ